MGKAARKRRADRKKQAKRAAKASRRSLYASYAGHGRRAKKRHVKEGPSPQKGNHAMPDCGNVGCERCYPQYRVKRQNEIPAKKIAA